MEWEKCIATQGQLKRDTLRLSHCFKTDRFCYEAHENVSEEVASVIPDFFLFFAVHCEFHGRQSCFFCFKGNHTTVSLSNLTFHRCGLPPRHIQDSPPPPPAPVLRQPRQLQRLQHAAAAAAEPPVPAPTKPKPQSASIFSRFSSLAQQSRAKLESATIARPGATLPRPRAPASQPPQKKAKRKPKINQSDASDNTEPDLSYYGPASRSTEASLPARSAQAHQDIQEENRIGTI